MNSRNLHFFTGVLVLLALGACSTAPEKQALDIQLDIQPFIALATTPAHCNDLHNDLYVIDNAMVFWRVEGRCADAGYGYMLYGPSVDSLYCSEYETIAGPQGTCEDTYIALFQTIRTHLDEPDLGLGSEHRVIRVTF